MAFGKLVNLFALSSLAVLVCNYGITPTNALSVESHDALRFKRAHGHDGLAKKRRSAKYNKKRADGATCRTRPASQSGGQQTTPASQSSPTVIQSSQGGGNSGSGSEGTTPSSTQQSSSAGSTPTTTPVTNGGNGKLGLAWPNGDEQSLSNFVNDKTKYLYTWSEYCPPSAANMGVECMPMLWSNTGDRVARWQQTVTAGYAKIAMGFNEVNEPGQANMGVGDGVAAWQQYIQPLKDQGYSLLSPCTSSNPNGYDWMQQFFDQCSGCTFDGIPVHFYGTQASDMIAYIEKWKGFGKPIWVTEFACQNFNPAYENNGQQCSQDQVWQFYKTVTEYMENDPQVVAYFAFGVMRDMQGVNQLDQLMDPSSSGTTPLMNAIMNSSF